MEAQGRAAEFTPQGLANTAVAFATAGHDAPTLFDAFGAEALRRVGEFNLQDLAGVTRAFRLAEHEAPELLEALRVEGERKRVP